MLEKQVILGMKIETFIPWWRG